jgi:hypothetical protein
MMPDNRAPAKLPSPHDIRRLAVECHRHPQSIRNAYEGRAKPIVDAQVREAAIRLGLPWPEKR